MPAITKPCTDCNCEEELDLNLDRPFSDDQVLLYLKRSNPNVLKVLYFSGQVDPSIQRIILNHDRTVKSIKKVEDVSIQSCSNDYCCEEEKSCFFSEMEKYGSNEGVTMRVLKTCIILMLQDVDPYYKSTAQVACKELLGYKSDIKVHKLMKVKSETIASKLRNHPKAELIQAMLNELGFYVTWVKAVSQNLRKFISIGCKMLPFYSSEKSNSVLQLFSYAPSVREYMVKHYEVTLYLKSFYGNHGMQGVFYEFMYLLLKVFDPAWQPTNYADNFFFDIDVRRPILSMGQIVGFRNEQVCSRTMPIIFEDSEYYKSSVSEEKYCLCGNLATRSYYFVTPARVNYCDKMCYLLHLSKVCPIVDRSLELVKYQDEKEAREDFKYLANKFVTSVMVDLGTLVFWSLDNKKLLRQHAGDNLEKLDVQLWLKVSSLDCIGPYWEKWSNPVEEMSNEKISVCWGCYLLPETVNHAKLQLCSSCRKARYCSLDCAQKNWEHHKQFCNNQKVARVLSKYKDTPTPSLVTKVTWNEDEVT